MQQNEFSWTSTNNIKIYAKEWQIENPKAVIALVHGMGEHCNRYDHWANFFNEKGFAVVGHDHVGHGRSEGKRGSASSFDAFLDGVDELLEQTKQRYPNTPTFLYGHSMGGNISLNHLLKRNPNVVGLVATGPWIKLAQEPPAMLIKVGRVFNKLGGFSQGNGLDANNISTDKAEVAKYVNDPLVHDRVHSVAGIALADAGDWLYNYKGTVKTPLLIMHGGDDKITSPKGSKQFVSNVDGDVTYKEWAGMYHEIHNEKDRLSVYNHALDWMNKYL